MSFPSIDIVNFAIFKQRETHHSPEPTIRHHHPSVHHYITPYFAKRFSFPVKHSTLIRCLRPQWPRRHITSGHQRQVSLLLASFNNLHIWCCAVKKEGSSDNVDSCLLLLTWFTMNTACNTCRCHVLMSFYNSIHDWNDEQKFRKIMKKKCLSVFFLPPVFFF